MKNTKNSIALITLSCFVGQILSGCNAGSSSIAHINKNINEERRLLKSHVVNSDKLGIDYENANNKKELWTNQFQDDWNIRDSRVNFQSTNKTGYDIELVGCEKPSNLPDDAIDTNQINKVFDNSKMIATSDEMRAKGYPEFIPDPTNFESTNYIRFKNMPLSSSGKFNCYYSIEIDGAGKMYFKLVDEYDSFYAWKDKGDILNGAISTATKDYQQPWKRLLIQHGVFAVVSIVTPILLDYYKKSARGATYEQLVQDIIDKATQKNLNNLVKTNQRLLVAKKLGKITKEEYTQQITDEINKTIFKGAVNNQEWGTKFKDELIEVLNGKMHVLTEEGDVAEYQFKKFVIEDSKIKFKLFGNWDFVVEHNRTTDFKYPVSFRTPTAMEVADYEDGTSRLFFDAFEVKVNDGRLEVELGKDFVNMIKIDSRLCTLGYRFAVGFGTAIGGFIVITAIIDVIERLLSHDTQGATYDGENYISFASITNSEAILWNKGKLSEKHISANALVTKVGANNSNEGHYQISFKTDSGFNTQEVITLNAYSKTEPFLRPQLVDGKDPYLGDEISHGSSKWDDAVVELEFLSNTVDEKTNELEDVYNQTYQGLGFGLLHTEALPNPDYQLTKITDTKTAKTLYSQGKSSNSSSLIKATGWNNIQVGAIKGLAMNTDQAVEMQVKISKEAAQAKLGAEGDVIGNGFVAKFIEESGNGAETIDSIRSDSYEALLKKRYAESPELAMPYLYNVYTCDYPTKVGDACGLKMHIGGMDNDKHLGKIYIADGASRTTAIPVYLNYHLLGSYFELNVSDKTSPYKIDIMNTHNEAYTKMTLEYKSVDDDSYLPVPMDMLTKDTTCNLDSGLQPQTQCSIYFDFSKIDSDSYQFRINGIKSTAKLGAPDWFDVKVRVN